MTKNERNNWLMNIESVAAEVAANIGQETVDFVLSKYGAKNVYALKSSDLSEVYVMNLLTASGAKKPDCLFYGTET